MTLIPILALFFRRFFGRLRKPQRRHALRHHLPPPPSQTINIRQTYRYMVLIPILAFFSGASSGDCVSLYGDTPFDTFYAGVSRCCAACTRHTYEHACLGEAGCGWAPLEGLSGICVSGVPDFPCQVRRPLHDIVITNIVWCMA